MLALRWDDRIDDHLLTITFGQVVSIDSLVYAPIAQIAHFGNQPAAAT